MNRNYIPKLYVEGVPASESLNYVKKQVIKYRERYSDFDKYLKDLKIVLEDKYQALNEIFDNTFRFTSNVLGRDSIFNTLVKLYNYHFSIEQSYDYINRLYDIHKKLIDGRLEVTSFYFEKDAMPTFVLQLVGHENHIFKDYYPFTIYFSTSKYGEIQYLYDSDVEKYWDSWVIFSSYDNDLLNKMMMLVHQEYDLIIDHAEEIEQIYKNKTPLSISSIQKACSVGFGLASKIYRLLKNNERYL